MLPVPSIWLVSEPYDIVELSLIDMNVHVCVSRYCTTISLTNVFLAQFYPLTNSFNFHGILPRLAVILGTTTDHQDLRL